MECIHLKFLMMNGKINLVLLLWCTLLVGCQKPANNVSFSFSFSVDGDPLQQDTMRYTNAAGNLYEVTEAQYFISNVVLTKEDGTQVRICSDSGAHYVDADIPTTLRWLPTDKIPAGVYTSLTFVFGLSPELNTTNFYVNPPENNMSWPILLGGGYHHLKINGRWLTPQGVHSPFNLHMGNGQVYDAAGNLSSVIDNSFTVFLPCHFEVARNETSELTLEMDVNRWFDNPYLFDWNEIGGSIMQNQTAQEMLKANGCDVFRIR